MPVIENVHGGITVTRDFRLDVVPSDNSSQSSATDIEAQPFRHLEYSSQKYLDPFRSPLSSPAKSARFTEISLRDTRCSEASIKAGTFNSSTKSSTVVGSTELTHKSATPSIASTLRSPTELLPLVRIASDSNRSGSLFNSTTSPRRLEVQALETVHLQPISPCHVRDERRNSGDTV